MRISDGSSDGCSSDLWTSCFMVLFALVGVALAWMHIAIRQMEQKASGIDARSLPQFPEMAGLHDETRHAAAQPSKVLAEWKPEDPDFWETTGERSEEHTSELQSLMHISYAVFCSK